MAALGDNKSSCGVMSETIPDGSPDCAAKDAGGSAVDSISIVQRGNLKTIETTLRKQWRLGQNIVLCWSATDNGILLLLVPHYFLGNFSAAGGEDQRKSNERYIRELLAGQRRMERDDFFEVTNRLGVSATFIKLPTPLEEEPLVTEAIEQIIRRYGLSYVESRAVLLFDIAEFSLYTPFEQASQLNSLSYSMNSAYNKMLSRGIEINFARTTTGDGYYVWNRDLGHGANEDLLHFLMLVIADNAIAREASKGNTVPLIRSAYHIGGHYELYQAEGVNPTVFSYIVGDVTIELARMVDLARPGQLLIGDFRVEFSLGDDQGSSTITLDTLGYLEHCNKDIDRLLGIPMSGHSISRIECSASSAEDANGDLRPRRYRLTDKHGLSRNAYNLELLMETGGGRWTLGLCGDKLTDFPGIAEGDDGSQPTTLKSVSEE